MHNEPTILLVDDDANDVLLFRFALGRSPLDADLRVAHSGLEAVKYLSGYGPFGNRAEFPVPGIVLLDLHMPGIDGLAVLRWIRRQDSLAGLPVAVFTGDKRWRTEAMEYGADIYMRKGEDTGELLALLQQINLHWQQPALTGAACSAPSGKIMRAPAALTTSLDARNWQLIPTFSPWIASRAESHRTVGIERE